jgi:uncharacterized protein YkwD
MAARCTTVVLAAMALAVMAAVALSAVEPKEAGAAVDTETVRACDEGSIALEPNERRALALHNQARRSYGLIPLCVDPVLTAAARVHSDRMIQLDLFAHGDVGARLTRHGYEWLTYGENIAGGYGYYASSPDNIFDMWMASPGHHANIVNGSFEEVGIGTATGEYNGITGYTMYTADFGTQR